MSESTPAAPTLAAVENQAAGLALRGASAVLSAAPGAEPTWAKPAVSIATLVVFAGLVVVAYVSKDNTSLAILSGVGASMAQQTVGYWIGSSSGSARKTALLAASPAIPAAPGT